MNRLNPINTSIFDFPTLIEKGYVYVDKTAQIYEIVKPSPLPRHKVEVVEFKTESEKRAFIRNVARRARECQPAREVA